MKPYYEDDAVTIYHGEALATLCGLGSLCVSGIVTDPPYSSGGAYRGDRMQSVISKYQQSDSGREYLSFTGDNRDQRSYLTWCSLWLGAAKRHASPAAFLGVFSDWRQLPTMTDCIQCAGWIWRGIAVWDKTEAARGIPGRLRNQCEFIVWGTNGPIPATTEPPIRGAMTLYLNPAEKDHLTQKPLSVMRWLVSACPNGSVLDPFMGSGTTLRAAKDLGRKAIGIEIEERYCEIAAKRMAQEVLDLGPPKERKRA